MSKNHYFWGLTGICEIGNFAKEMKIRNYILFALSCFPFFVCATEDEKLDTVFLQEVNVSAIKQDANLRTIGVASTIVDRKEAERLNIVSLKTVSDLVPNFYIPDYGSRITSSIYVRGIGARMDQPAVGLIVDNVPVLNKDAYDFDIADIAHVEMMRGPQSTLYGRNTMGGLINITTLSPLRYQGVRLFGEYGSGNSWKMEGSWYHKIGDNIGLSVIGQYQSTDGFYDNEYNGEKCDWEKMMSGRVKFEWRISRRVSLFNTFSVSNLHQGGYPYEYVPTGTISYNDTCFYKRLNINDGLTIRWLHDKFTFSSISSVQYIDDNMTLDQDFRPIEYFTLTQAKKEWGITQDFVIKSTGESKYKWLVGAFAFYKNLDMSAPVIFKDYGISQLIEKHRNDANPTYPIYWNERTFPLNSDFVTKTFGVALYHESKLDLGNWHFTAGLRLDYESVMLDYRSYCDTGYTVYKQNDQTGDYEFYRNTDIVIDERGNLNKSFLELLPKVSVVYDLPVENSANVYAAIAKGYKSGGFNTQMFSDFLQQRLMRMMGIGALYNIDDIVGYKPEESWNYELGAHLECAGGKVKTDLALFYIDCRNQQLTVFPDGTTTGRVMTNAGKTRSFGAEISVAYFPIMDLGLNFSYGYTNAKFKEYNNGKMDFAGKYIPYAPCHTLFLSAVYDLAVNAEWLDKIVIDANLRGIGEIYWNESNTAVQPFYALLGASLTFVKKNLSLQLWGQNLTNTKYKTFYFVSMNNEFVQRAKPIRIGATLRFDF